MSGDGMRHSNDMEVKLKDDDHHLSGTGMKSHTTVFITPESR